jgi:PAS domain S-box-containing protein
MVALLGLSVMAGWIFEYPVLMQIHPDFSPMQFNTALGFLFCGTAILLVGQEKAMQAGFLGILIFLLGSSTLLEYVLRLNIGIDNLIIETPVFIHTEFQGRMAFNTALCFMIIGAGLYVDLYKDKKKSEFLLIGLSGALLICFSMIVLSGYLFNLESSLGLGNLMGMALHSAFGFLFAGIALIIYASEYHKIEGIIKSFFIVILLVSMGIIWALVGLRKQVEDDWRSELQTTLKITEDALKIWGNEVKKTAIDWSELSEVRLNVKELLVLPQVKNSLLSSQPIKKLDSLLEAKIKRHKFAGYIVISPDFINLASLLKFNVGSTNLLAEEKDYLQRAFKGETLITLPIRTEIPLPIPGKGLDPESPTMFVLTPVYNEANKIMAVLAFRLDAFLNFNPILRLGRPGRTGETYAFDKMGRMLSESRYESALRKLGVLGKNESSILSTVLKDPGFEPRKNNSPAAFKNLPFTQIVSQVFNVQGPVFINGYRDYRGVEVIGAGTWVKSLDLGVITELDSQEAWRNYDFSYNLVVIGLLMIISLFFALSSRLYYQRNQLIIKEEKANNLLKAVEESPVPIIITNVLGDIEYVNPKFSELTQIKAIEALGQNMKIFNSCRQAVPSYKNLLPTITQGKNWFGEVQIKKNNEEFIWVSQSIAPAINNSNKITHFIIVWDDISSRKEEDKHLEERRLVLAEAVKIKTEELNETNKQLIQSEKLSAVGKLAASLAHEFNNPIFGIRSVLERINEQISLPDTHSKSVGIAIRECSRISSLVGSLMDFNRPTTNEYEYGNLHECIDEILFLVIKKLKDRNITLSKNYSRNIPKVWIVADQIKQVVLNLVHNAEEAIGDNGGRIEIFTEFKDPYVILTISDNGQGIEEINWEKIFDPFFTTKNVVKGAGLGLSISYGIVSSHGGTILARNDLEGCSFIVTLPTNRRINTVFEGSIKRKDKSAI